MTESIRKLASIQKVIALDPIKGADRIEVATTLGWKLVVRKGEFKVGDLCIYIEVDSVLPEGLLKEANLWDEEKGKGRLAGKNGDRLKTVRLRKQISQGLALPVDLVDREAANFYGYDQEGNVSLWDWGMCEGEDVTEALGITKYEPPIPVEMRGVMKGVFPAFLAKTDSHRLQSYPELIQEMAGVECYATIKVDGTSSTFYNRLDISDVPEFGVCSRNTDLLESEGNLYWRMAHKYGLVDKLPLGTAIQAETFGPSIQGNLLGTTEVGLEVFDVFDIVKRRYYDYEAQVKYCQDLGLPRVQDVYVGKFQWSSVEDLIEFANGLKYPNGASAEGVVIRPLVERYSEVLGGRMAFKVISPQFLLKHE